MKIATNSLLGHSFMKNLGFDYRGLLPCMKAMKPPETKNALG